MVGLPSSTPHQTKRVCTSCELLCLPKRCSKVLCLPERCAHNRRVLNTSPIGWFAGAACFGITAGFPRIKYT